MVSIHAEDPSAPDALLLMEELSATLAAITGDSGKASFDPEDVRQANARFVVARDGEGRALGCGAFRPLRDGVAEVKRMFARPGHPGTGSAILSHLEAEAAALGYQELWGETRRINQRALGFYLRHGYLVIPNYGKYVGNGLAACFAKVLRLP